MTLKETQQTLPFGVFYSRVKHHEELRERSLINCVYLGHDPCYVKHDSRSASDWSKSFT